MVTAELLRPEAAARLFDQALALHRQGRLVEATGLYADIESVHPAHVPTLCCLALCRIAVGAIPVALRLGRRAAVLSPESAEAWHSLGNAEAADGDHLTATRCFRRMLAVRPDFAEGHNNLGNALMAIGDLDQAVHAYGRALRTRPDYAEAHYNQGNVLATLARPGDALGRFRAAIALKPDFVAAFNSLGTVLQEQQSLSTALAAFGRASVLDPVAVRCHIKRGNLLERVNRAADATLCYETALLLDPGDGDAHFGRGNGLSALKRYGDALPCYSRALTRLPAFAEAHNNAATALQALARLPEATLRLRRAIVLQPDFSFAYNNMGSILQGLDDAMGALPFYRRATLLAPGDAVAHNNTGIALTEVGQLDDAVRAFERAIDLDPQRGYFYRMLADSGRLTPNSAQVRRMEDLAGDQPGLADADRLQLHFALGRVYGDDGQAERSMRHLLAGNRLKRATLAFDERESLALYQRLRMTFTAELLAQTPHSGVMSRVPVFVVGMPRSGTSLIEQILASHPAVFGAGEVTSLPRLADGLRDDSGKLVFPACVPTLSIATLAELAHAYLGAVRIRAPAADRIIDKMPANFKLIGLIRLALPEARIIHVRRDPVDTCLSCFSKLFAGPQPYAYDLAELGRQYRAYAELMAHWRTIVPPDVMLEVRYEDVVADLAGQTERLLAHCGLDWDERCLTFHQTRRVVRTASATQVRQPLYATSIGRWHVYGDVVQPLIDALAGHDEV